MLLFVLDEDSSRLCSACPSLELQDEPGPPKLGTMSSVELDPAWSPSLESEPQSPDFPRGATEGRGFIRGCMLDVGPIDDPIIYGPCPTEERDEARCRYVGTVGDGPLPGDGRAVDPACGGGGLVARGRR